MAKKAKAKRAKAEKLPPDGTEWQINGNAYFRFSGGKVQYRNGPDCNWLKSSVAINDLRADNNYTEHPPTKPARDTAAMRRKAVALAKVGCVYYSKATVKSVRPHKGGLVGTVEFVIPADGYAKFLADPTCGGAAS